MSRKQFSHENKGQEQHSLHSGQAKTDTKTPQKNWKELFQFDPINLKVLQKKSLIEKARRIIKDIAKGVSYTQFKGKRMNYNRHVISVPINRDYRLIYRETETGLEIADLMNHEQYNVKKPGSRKI